MKKIIFLFSILISVLSIKAQSASETIEFINAKITEASAAFYCTTVQYGGKCRINASSVYVYDDNGRSCEYYWSSFTSIAAVRDRNCIKFATGKQFEGKNTFIEFWMNDEVIRNKLVKACRHMAELAGAKLVSEDLF